MEDEEDFWRIYGGFMDDLRMIYGGFIEEIGGFMEVTPCHAMLNCFFSIRKVEGLRHRV